MDRNDFKLVGLLVDGYIRRHATIFTGMVKTHRELNASVKEIQKRNPILYLDFTGSHPPRVQDITLHNEVPKELESAEPEHFDEVRRMWKSTRTSELLLSAWFPGQVDRSAYPVTLTVKFPLEPDGTVAWVNDGYEATAGLMDRHTAWS
ncbi:hypothetical protein PM082_018332 [Marasmius tenuissimus]|nr:hypothetical protein PM082_018332 [Marasmius tenuissimus]